MKQKVFFISQQKQRFYFIKEQQNTSNKRKSEIQKAGKLNFKAAVHNIINRKVNINK